jgi:hypothetical protein
MIMMTSMMMYSQVLLLEAVMLSLIRYLSLLCQLHFHQLRLVQSHKCCNSCMLFALCGSVHRACLVHLAGAATAVLDSELHDH